MKQKLVSIQNLKEELQYRDGPLYSTLDKTPPYAKEVAMLPARIELATFRWRTDYETNARTN